MRTFITLSIIMSLAFCSGCGELTKDVLPKTETTEIYTLGDRTDSLKVRPSDEVLSLCNIDDDHIYNGYNVHFKDIADISENEEYDINIKSASPIFSSSTERIAEMKSYEQRVRDLFKQCKSNYRQTQNRSLVYSAVISQVNKLSKVKADHKFLLIYSDMLDHCDDFLDIYNPVMAEMVAHHPEEVMQSLESKLRIEPLDGIKVIIIYQSRDHDYRTEKLHVLASNFYRALLTRHHADVVIATSLDAAKVNL